MTSVYVIAEEDLAKEIHGKIPEIKFIWRLFTYDRYTDFSIFRIEHESFPVEFENKLIKLYVTQYRQENDTYTFTFECVLEDDQSPLELLRAKPKSKPRVKRKTK